MARRKKDSVQLELSFPEVDEVMRLREENRVLRNDNDRLRKQIADLTAEIQRLRRTGSPTAEQQATDLGPFGHAGQVSETAPEPGNETECHPVTKQSNIEAKIELFRSYFKGREDVYAVRASSSAEIAPYYPKRQYRGKERGQIQWGEYLPLTNEVIRAHLQEDKHPVTIGIYPLLLDETCWFLVIDFDKASWKEDTAAFLETCQEFQVPAALERSRSGNGGHVWIFFSEPLPARTVRRLGARLLTRTLERRNQIGLDSYDRMFPNQDTLPKDKQLGNLIALPLQRLAARVGNSLFIDGNHIPYPDQWVFLSSIKLRPCGCRHSSFRVSSIVLKITRNISLCPEAVWKKSSNCCSPKMSKWKSRINAIQGCRLT